MCADLSLGFQAARTRDPRGRRWYASASYAFK